MSCSNLILAVIFGTLLSYCFCSGYKSKHSVSEMLLENLTKYHSKLPNDVELNFSDYYTRFDFLEFKNTAIENKSRLIQFNSYFVFSDPIFNSSMRYFIFSNFSDFKNISDRNLKDSLNLAIIKYLRKEIVGNRLPNDQFYMFLCFMNEIVYGPDSSICSSESQWKIELIQNFINKGDDIHMENSLNYYLNCLIGGSKYLFLGDDRRVSAYEHISEIIKFFKSKPDLESIKKQFISKTSNFWSNLNTIAPEILFAVQRAISKFNHLPQKQSEFAFLNNYIIKNNFDTNDFNTKKSIYKLLNTSKTNYCQYLWSRDSTITNAFELGHYLTLNQGNVKNGIKELISVTNPKIIHLDIFRKLIQSGDYSFESSQASQFSLQFEIFSKSPHFLQMLLTECPTPVNMFLQYGNKYRHMFMYPEISFENLKVYVESLEADDIFQVLTINFENLKFLTSSIIDKFDLNMRYKIDFDLSLVDLGGVVFKYLNTSMGKILTIKQIFELLQVKGLLQIFTTKPDLCFDDVLANSKRPISLKKFILEGAIEPIENSLIEQSCQIC